jgi:hypothetical protein
MVEAILDLVGRLLCYTQHSRNQQKIEGKEPPFDLFKTQESGSYCWFRVACFLCCGVPSGFMAECGGEGDTHIRTRIQHSHRTPSFHLWSLENMHVANHWRVQLHPVLRGRIWRPVAHTILGEIPRHDVGIDPRIDISNMTGKRRLKTSESSG